MENPFNDLIDKRIKQTKELQDEWKLLYDNIKDIDELKQQCHKINILLSTFPISDLMLLSAIQVERQYITKLISSISNLTNNLYKKDELTISDKEILDGLNEMYNEGINKQMEDE